VARRTLARDQKKADEEQRTIVWIDEAGFYLLPALVRTYAPRGHTPVLRVPLTRDHLSVISAITPAGKLYLAMQPQAYKSPAVVRFLQHLLRQIPGKLLVLWDGAPIHRGQPVKDFLAGEAGQRVWLETLPAYAPELNPDEGVWQRLKYSELKNVCCATLQELRRALRLATARLRHKRDSLLGCLRQVGYVL
jgi:transposase